MKRMRIARRVGSAMGTAVVLTLPGCGTLLASNLLLGAREGALTTTTGVIEDYFDTRFGITAEGDVSEDSTPEEESGNDLFVRL